MKEALQHSTPAIDEVFSYFLALEQRATALEKKLHAQNEPCFPHASSTTHVVLNSDKVEA